MYGPFCKQRYQALIFVITFFCKRHNGELWQNTFNEYFFSYCKFVMDQVLSPPIAQLKSEMVILCFLLLSVTIKYFKDFYFLLQT